MPRKWEHRLFLFNTHAHYLKHSIRTTGHIRLTCCTNPVHHPLWNLILHVKHHICSDWLWLRHVTQQFHVWGGQTNYFLLGTCLIKLRCSWSSPKSTGTLLTVSDQGIVFPLDWHVYCHVPLHLMLKKWNSSYIIFGEKSLGPTGGLSRKGATRWL